MIVSSLRTSNPDRLQILRNYHEITQHNPNHFLSVEFYWTGILMQILESDWLSHLYTVNQIMITTERCTIIKQKILSNNHQICRINICLA